MIDVNDGEPQRGGELIPNGTKARVIGTIRPGGANRYGQEKVDAGYLTASRSSDVLFLSWEFTIVDGPFARRKFWQNMTVAGGEVNEKGESKAWNITKSTLRAMLNSARNVKPDDNTERGMSARRFNSWGELNGIEFCCSIRVQKAKPGSNYQDSNAIGTVIEPDHKDYAALMSGVDTSAPAASAPAPAWAGNAQAAKPASTGGAMPAWAR
jgi:hypothetical protein